MTLAFRGLSAVVAAALWLSCPPVLAATPAPERQEATHRVVFELTSPQPATWEGLLNNLENTLAAFGQATTRIEVVAHGQGIRFMMKADAKNAARMEALARRGVVFAACNNAMRRLHVTKDQLMPFVTVVPSGVAEVILKQEAGWAYIKSGQ